MTTLDFTWVTALKLFAGVLLVGVWLLARQQAKLDKRAARSATAEDGRPSASQRIIPRSQILIVVAAILFLIVVLVLGNRSTL